MNNDVPAYGLWPLVIINAGVFIIFAFSFSRPRTARDWRSFGAFSAFLVALFTEMYGFPLTIYLLSGWLGTVFPGIHLFSHNTGHLWETLMGWKGDPHLSVGFIIIMLGFLAQWPTLLTLIMFPILVTMYVRLARREERDAQAEFGDAYARYAMNTPAFFPRLRKRTPVHA
jgi:protein-S-isoprenylcysteine O-methyltransferase Ste14